MPEITHVAAKSGDVLLLVGTTKGAFLFKSNADRTEWITGGPYFPGRAIYALIHDQRPTAVVESGQPSTVRSGVPI